MTTGASHNDPASIADLRDLLEQVPVGSARKAKLCVMMSGPDRFYHNLEHLAVLWRRHCSFGANNGMHGPQVHHLIAAAIAFHDAIYHSERCDNEARSADFWMNASDGTSFSQGEREWVAETIVATQDHLGYEPKQGSAWDLLPLDERARLWFLDLDLTPIGEAEADFHANTRRLRAERPSKSDEEVERGRLNFLGRMAKHTAIYRSPVLSEAFETSARRNLARELACT